MALPSMIANGPCPFVDEGDGRCDCRMTKQSLADAFDFCLGGRHHTCQTFHSISWELRAQADDAATNLQHGTPARHDRPAATHHARPGSPSHTVPARLTIAGQPITPDPTQALPVRGTG